MSDTTSGPQQPSPILPVLQVTALQLAPELRCSARLHTQDMLQRHFVSQVNPDGQDPGQRMTAAGFSHGPFAEAIVAHATDAAHVLSSLLADDRVCRSLSTMQLTAIGVGHDEDLWTLDFAGP
jgi:uncharacterized protein YkwD